MGLDDFGKLSLGKPAQEKWALIGRRRDLR